MLVALVHHFRKLARRVGHKFVHLIRHINSFFLFFDLRACTNEQEIAAGAASSDLAVHVVGKRDRGTFPGIVGCSH